MSSEVVARLRSGERFLTTDLYQRPKLRVDHVVHWDHHRGGWGDVTQLLERELSCPDGTLVVNAVEETLATGRVLDTPWVGFSHEVPHHGYDFPDLARTLELPAWRASIRKCRGLWVLSRYEKEFLEAQGLPFPVSSVQYPTAVPQEGFRPDLLVAAASRRLLFIGSYLRRIQDFYDLVAPGYVKLVLPAPDLGTPVAPRHGPQPVRHLERVDDAGYDSLLTRSVVFLSLADAGANTTVVECIARGTPLLVNRVGGVEEYLGDDYPLYYDSLEEAAGKLADTDLLVRASEHLLAGPVRPRLTFGAFSQQLQNTAVYRDLPVPPTVGTRFPRYDLTVLICTYKRPGCLATQLARLVEQDFSGSFEVVIWNNNAQIADEVARTAQELGSRLAIRVISSSENLYCAVRLAAPALMRSDALMICDDDVVPGPHYLQTFWDKHVQYGPRSVISARGHTFLPHRLDTDDPQRVWREQRLVQFHDEFGEDRQVHFVHADNCLVPRALLIAAAQVEMPRPEYVLVDDYWLSFVLSHRVGCELWKIRAGDVFTYDPSADDARIAMFQDPRVREQRVNLYQRHMREGWPFPGTEAG
jgi:glycosyltransferase involved in cell wall biosynthesis